MSGGRSNKDEFNSSDIDSLIAGDSGYTSGNGQITCTTSWQAVLSSPPSEAYAISLSYESVSGTVRWAYDNTSAPSSSNGNKILGAFFSICLPAGSSFYVTSDNAGDTINYTYRTI